MIQQTLKILFVLIILGQSTSSFAHRYFFGLTELSVNPNHQTLEVIHQFTAHDIENAIAEIKQENFSPEHKHYDSYIRNYFNQHFKLLMNNENIELDWVGLEVNQGKIYVFQEAVFKNNLAGLVVKNDLLVDTYTKQVNTVNYQDSVINGSLTFTGSKKVATIVK
ncbi:DUF6702 family protein [Thalassotalea sp. G2M2-11]|uniref:DUF6702 family protein n=1 Tax=Thalassotalea sp. G2M2-11 TaxID=2787627 RepID=UPI0019D27986|nr:DUF6702 family protein [Thalassotalea sp. G2M2-11]